MIGRVVNGRDANKCEVTHQVLIVTLGAEGGRCGGSILNRLYVLTANHCNIDFWVPDKQYPDNILGIKMSKFLVQRAFILDEKQNKGNLVICNFELILF